MDWDELLRQRVLIVSGKGGTGKSTVAAALALAAARGGHRVLLAEVEGRREATRTLGVEDPGFQERLTPLGPSVISIEPVQAAIEYLRLYGGGIDLVTRPLLRTGVLEQVIAVAPGFRDLLITGKLYEVGDLRRTNPRDRGRPLYDLIVVDAPPTGQIGAFLDAARTFAGLMHVGQLRRRAMSVAAFLRRCRLVLVTVPEEMSVAETLETIPALRASGVRLGAIVLNRVAPATLPRGVRRSLNTLDDERLAQVLAGAGVAASAHDAATLRAGALTAEARRRTQLAFRDPLARAGPILLAPEMRGTSPIEVVRELAWSVAGPSGGEPDRVPSDRGPASFPSRRAMPRTERSLAPHLEDARIVVVCGAGGVGKTSVSAAVALHRAASGTETVLLTVDPARRLATALRLPMLAGERAEVPVGRGRTLQAMQLDTQRTFDELIERNAGSPERRDRILANPFYRRIADTLAGTHEYMAMEKLYELDREEHHELIVIDTPPTRSALSFLEAPNRLTDFLGGRFLRWMLWPTARAGRLTLSAARIGAGAFLRTVGRLIGADVLADTIDFLASFEGMYGDFKQRADGVLELLRSPACAFVVVTSPGRASLDEAGFFVERLTAKGMRPAAVVVNRWHPEAKPLPAGAGGAAERLAAGPSPEERSAAALLAARLRDEPRRAAEANGMAAFASRHPAMPLLAVPDLPGDVHDTAGLRRLAAHLFGGG